ncbi:hypothetical protein HPB47_011784 [Ixodes persulcatus]|uniref:Uncharacterized protein n=1 Tax=Ixodes persulcatus TaxID=34615 RepID=A0AC60NVE4_IXOPE|nr:hypothetical protein HPB47_011784 [Ixodes persulcatus]
MPDYLSSLPEPERQRYRDKLCVDGVAFDDPYAVNKACWTSDVKLLPPKSTAHVVVYLVFSPSQFTADTVAYKSLEAYDYFESVSALPAGSAVCEKRARSAPNPEQTEHASAVEGCNRSPDEQRTGEGSFVNVWAVVAWSPLRLAAIAGWEPRAGPDGVFPSAAADEPAPELSQGLAAAASASVAATAAATANHRRLLSTEDEDLVGQLDESQLRDLLVGGGGTDGAAAAPASSPAHTAITIRHGARRRERRGFRKTRDASSSSSSSPLQLLRSRRSGAPPAPTPERLKRGRIAHAACRVRSSGGGETPPSGKDAKERSVKSYHFPSKCAAKTGATWRSRRRRWMDGAQRDVPEEPASADHPSSLHCDGATVGDSGTRRGGEGADVTLSPRRAATSPSEPRRLLCHVDDDDGGGGGGGDDIVAAGGTRELRARTSARSRFSRFPARALGARLQRLQQQQQ